MIAFAQIIGSPLAPNLKGKALFRDVPGGVEICVEVTGLPNYSPKTASTPQIGPHGFHLHIVGNCEVGNPNDPFQSAGGHFNPTKQLHGNHAGDFPVIFSNNGYFRMCFYTNKFSVFDILNKAVVIHQSPDDYQTEPAGNSGKRIGCGVIKELKDWFFTNFGVLYNRKLWKE